MLTKRSARPAVSFPATERKRFAYFDILVQANPAFQRQKTIRVYYIYAVRTEDSVPTHKFPRAVYQGYS